MTRTLTIVALLLGSLPAEAQVLTLSCDGEAKGWGTEEAASVHQDGAGLAW